jgi:serine/threonine/tyrosine-interacting protein
MASNYAATHQYRSGKSLDNHLPNVVVPPVDYSYANGIPTLILQTSHDDRVHYQGDKYGDLAYLRQLAATKPINLGTKLLNWEFDARRKAQSILPFLYLGPGSVMRDIDFLDNAGITFLLAVRDLQASKSRPKYLNPANSPGAVNRQTATFDSQDSYDFMIGMKANIKTLVHHLQATTNVPFQSTNDIGGKILICCETGNERSAAFAAAFLMVIYGLPAFEAIQVVHSQRFSVAIEDNMRRMLVTFGDMLAAESQVIGAQLVAQNNASADPQIHGAGQKKKREYNLYDEENDEDMEDVDHREETEDERAGVAPFRDISR